MSYLIKEIEFSKVCRTCLSSAEDMKSLYATDPGLTYVCIAEMLMSFTSLKLSGTDGFPTQICCICVSKLNQFHTFQLKCLQSENILRNYEENIVRTEERNDFEQVLIKKESPIYSDNINEFAEKSCANGSLRCSNIAIDQRCAITKSLQDPLTIAELQTEFSQELDFMKHELIDMKTEYVDNVNSSPVKQSERTTTLSEANKKPYSCTVCGSSFRDKAYLLIHSRKHTGEKPYSCTECNKSFARTHHLTYHMRKHTGEKPYTCTFCNSAFIQKGTLTNHLRIHTGEKPYLCGMCNIAFARKQHLINHMWTHTGEKPYTCTVCDHSYILKAALKAHMRKHS